MKYVSLARTSVQLGQKMKPPSEAGNFDETKTEMKRSHG